MKLMTEHLDTQLEYMTEANDNVEKTAVIEGIFMQD